MAVVVLASTVIMVAVVLASTVIMVAVVLASTVINDHPYLDNQRIRSYVIAIKKFIICVFPSSYDLQTYSIIAKTFIRAVVSSNLIDG